MLTAQRLIELLQLEPLPVEGGYFRRTYLAAEMLEVAALPGRYSHAKRLASAIYYLLREEEFSALHRLLTDEVYHLYLGDPVEMLLLGPDGAGETVVLGHDLEAGQRPQVVVPRGVWQGSRLRPGGRLALMGTTLAPAWDPTDFEAGQREALVRQYPAQAELIRALTRDL
jgi:predicted cupin superfamily sugar epimerase